MCRLSPVVALQPAALGLFGPLRLDLIAVKFRLWKPSAQARDLAYTREGSKILAGPGPTATLWPWDLGKSSAKIGSRASV